MVVVAIDVIFIVTIFLEYSSFIYRWLKIIVFVFEMLIFRWYILKVVDNHWVPVQSFWCLQKKGTDCQYNITKSINRRKSGRDSSSPYRTSIDNSKSSSKVWASVILISDYSDSISSISFIFDIEKSLRRQTVLNINSLSTQSNDGARPINKT